MTIFSMATVPFPEAPSAFDLRFEVVKVKTQLHEAQRFQSYHQERKLREALVAPTRARWARRMQRWKWEAARCEAELFLDSVEGVQRLQQQLDSIGLFSENPSLKLVVPVRRGVA
jgi:hypothetical protein